MNRSLRSLVTSGLPQLAADKAIYGKANLVEALNVDDGEVIPGGALQRLLGAWISHSGQSAGSGSSSLAHTGYRHRLLKRIGSGIVEGTCKTVIGRRLKQTGAAQFNQ